MLGKPLKLIAWIMGSVAAVAVGLYATAFAVNLHDQPASADAVRLTALYETRPELADDDNAYVYLLGFDAPLSDDPREVGTRRLAWLRSASETPFDRAGDPQTTRLETTSADPVVQQFRIVCGPVSRECADGFSGAEQVFEAWNGTHPWLLTRYRTLLGHAGWRQVVFDVSRPLPNYVPVLDGQRLLLLRVRVLADSGDTAAARELLASDVRFWRGALASTDALITKMIATAALRQHFAWGTLATRGLPPGRVAAAIPREWSEPMTPVELSLRRALVGEWMYFSRTFPTWYAANEQTFADRLARPLLQPQATLNRHAAYLSELAEILEAPLDGYARVTDDAAQLARRAIEEAFPPRSFYNVVGTLLMASGPPDYARYARRAADLEGIRRAALAAVTLRDAATPSSEASAALAVSPLRNPYDDQPLRWDADDEAVVFAGFDPEAHRFLR